MEKLVSKIKNMIQRDPCFAVRGPVMQGSRYVEQYGQTMVTLEFEVPHGTLIPNEFGFFVTVNIQNTNKSRCTIMLTCDEVANADGELIPVFRERESFIPDFNEFICRARVVTQLVDKDAVPLVGDDIWESSVEDYDNAHNVRTTTYILEQQDVRGSTWDNQLNRSHEVVSRLTRVIPAETGLITIAGPPVQYLFRSYSKVKCDWYEVTDETIPSDSGYTYCSNENYFWPAVLISDIVFGEIIGERDGEEYTAGITVDYELRESYSGPSLVDVAVSWSPTPADCNGVNQLLPTSISYQGILVNYSVPECLHGLIEMQELVGTNQPALKDLQFKERTYKASTMASTGGTTVVQANWPDTIVGSKESNPYKGGYLNITKVYHAPAPDPQEQTITQ